MKRIIVMLLLLLSSSAIFAQYGIKIKDRETDLPVQHVSVKILATGLTLKANDNGEITINGLQGEQALALSALGYRPDTVKFKFPLTKWESAVMQSLVTQLKEVLVSTGYQQLSKERATGSFSLVDNATFNEQSGTNVLDRLDGITPALSVDRRTYGGTMMVRGLSTISGDRAPLIVLDDFPYVGDIANLNPDDVESITVLKDAAAASIWGSQAGNGVIVITTKKAKYNTKVQVELGSNFSSSDIPRMNDYQNLSSADMIEVEKMLFGKGFYTAQENSTSRTPLSPVVELLIANRDGKLSQNDLNSALAYLATQDIVSNYRNSFYTQPLTQQYNISVKGGSATNSWNLFSGYNAGKSALGATSNKLNLKLENNFKLWNKLDLNLGLWFTQTENRSGLLEFSSITTSGSSLPPYTEFADAEGNALPVMKTYRKNYTDNLSLTKDGTLLDWNYYPLTDGNEVRTTGKQQDVLVKLKLDYKVLDALRISANYTMELAKNTSETFNSLNSYYTRDLINRYTQVSGSNVLHPVPLGAIVKNGSSSLNNQNLRLQLNFDKSWGKFNVNMLGGSELRGATTGNVTSLFYGVDENTRATGNVDYATALPTVFGSTGRIPNSDSMLGEVRNNVSLYFNGAVSFKDKYVLSGSARRDASNIFGVSTNNLWTPLWSTGIAWLASSEPWLKWRPLSYLRTRLTYGSSGNSDPKNAAVTTMSYSSTLSPYTGSLTGSINNHVNPDLRWELVKTINFGIDSRWLADRIRLSVEYYRKRAHDLISKEPIDLTAGVGSSVVRNVAQITAKGIDIELNTLNTNGKLKWSSGFFANFYKDRVDEYYVSSYASSTYISGSNVVTPMPGMPVYGAYGYRWAGLNPQNGNPRGYLNGQISEDYTAITRGVFEDLAYVGRIYPKVTGAFSNTFTWQGFSLTGRISYKFGHYYRKPNLTYSSLYNNRMGADEFSKRWQQPGDELHTNVPSLVYPAVATRDSFYGASEATYVSGDHIRLQNINLSYTLLKDKWKKMPFQRLVINGSINQLGILWKANHEKADPDNNDGLKTYTLNIQIKL